MRTTEPTDQHLLQLILCASAFPIQGLSLFAGVLALTQKSKSILGQPKSP